MPSSEKERLREALFHTREIEFYNEIKKRHEQGEISQEDVAILENVLFVEHQLEVVVASSDDFTPDLKKKLDSIKDKVFKNMQDMFGEEVIQSIQTNNPEEIAYSDSRVEEIIAKERNTRKHVLKEFVINEIKFIVNLQLYLENFSDEMAPELHEDIAEYIRSSKAMLQASGVDNVEEIFNQFIYLENNKKDYAESKDLKARENEIFAQIPDTKLKAESMANFYSECESRLLRIAHAAHDANIALISIDFATSSPQNTETSARNLFEGMRQLIGGGSSKELGDTAQEIEQNEDSKKDKQANLLGAIYNRVARIHMPAENYSQIRAGRPAFWIRKIKRDGLERAVHFNSEIKAKEDLAKAEKEAQETETSDKRVRRLIHSPFSSRKKPENPFVVVEQDNPPARHDPELFTPMKDTTSERQLKTLRSNAPHDRIQRAQGKRFDENVKRDGKRRQGGRFKPPDPPRRPPSTKI